MTPENWGLIHYEESVRRQLETVDAVADGGGERLIFCSHPPVVTLGRATTAEDVFAWGGETIPTTRGGRATYHGPSQLVIYPIVDLRKARIIVPARDVHAYLRALEGATTEGLRALGLNRAEARSSKVGDLSVTGVWVGQKKIASIGVAVRKWIAYHGVAINVHEDRAAFQGIRPCGFAPETMTNLERELGEPVDPAAVTGSMARSFLAALKV